MKNILIIEDDVPIGDLEEKALRKAGYGVSRAYSGTEALLLLDHFRPDLVLLDLMLPGLDGEAVLRGIRDIPVLVVSAKAEPDQKIKLLLGGAADYITKPFHVGELLARVAVQMRTHAAGPAAGAAPPLTFGEITLYPDRRVITAGTEEVRLTRTEYAILKLLMQNPAQVVTRSVLLERIGADTPDCTESSLKTHISHLRAKLRAPTGKDYIEAVWGIGFKMREQL